MNDLLPHVHGDEGEGATHWVCNARLRADGNESRCCECVPHEGCLDPEAVSRHLGHPEKRKTHVQTVKESLTVTPEAKGEMDLNEYGQIPTDEELAKVKPWFDAGWNWKPEFREYFDKTLNPKKPTMNNLDRELCVNFIERVEAQAWKEVERKWVGKVRRLLHHSLNYKLGDCEVVAVSTDHINALLPPPHPLFLRNHVYPHL